MRGDTKVTIKAKETAIRPGLEIVGVSPIEIGTSICVYTL